MTTYECCDTPVTNLKVLDEVCDSCRERIEAWLDDIKFEAYKEDYYG